MAKKRIVVGVSDAHISDDHDHVLATYSLGSCIGVCLYDPAIYFGGMLHFQLPDSKTDPAKAKEKPLMFADTGMEMLLERMVCRGANKKRLVVKIAGGAAMDTGPLGFDVGKRNYVAIRKVLWKHGMFIDAEDIGGSQPRNMHMSIANGIVVIRSNGLEKKI